MTVHSHGPTEGRGLDCPERRQDDGRLVGACLGGTEPINLAEIIATTIRDHSPTTGMKVASGETCRCGYWNGIERAGVDRPVGCGGLTWHQAQEAAAKIREALEGGE